MPGAEPQLLLVLIALLAGIGITAIGPGGIFLTIALFALLPHSPPVIAGTASATFVATGVLGSAMYLRSGELSHPENRRLAWVLSATSIAGALAGSWLNPYLPTDVFGALLGVMAIGVGILIVVQELRKARAARLSSAVEEPRVGDGTEAVRTPDQMGDGAVEPAPTNGVRGLRGFALVALLGLGIGLLGALLGVGGPVLAVPALVVLGVPMLAAVAVAQVQSVFVAAFATVGYAAQGAVSWPLALLVGLPQLIGAVAGWWIARRTAPEKLKIVLGVALIGVGVYLVL